MESMPIWRYSSPKHLVDAETDPAFGGDGVHVGHRERGGRTLAPPGGDDGLGESLRREESGSALFAELGADVFGEAEEFVERGALGGAAEVAEDALAGLAVFVAVGLDDLNGVMSGFALGDGADEHGVTLADRDQYGKILHYTVNPENG